MTIERDKALIDAAIHHALNAAELAPPRESCGLIVAIDGAPIYVPCRNVAVRAQDFVIHPDDFVSAEEHGQILAVVHSHVGVPPDPSPADLAGCAESGLPWLIVSVPLITWRWVMPDSSYRAPLLRRPYCYGVHDCYSLVRDYFLERLDIELPKFSAPWGWWHEKRDLYREKMHEAGFVELPRGSLPRLHDVIGMRVRAPVPNHLGVLWTQDHMLHHALNQLSSDTVYGGSWADLTDFVARHESMMESQA